MQRRGIRVTGVEEGSPAWEAGLEPGDEILSANGRPVPDELALKFYLVEDHVDLEVLRPDGSLDTIGMEMPDGQSFGVSVEDFRTRVCNNDCLFCFVKQLPPEARAALKVKDDDYRLSFLHGSYITLTNLREKDLDRIIEHALSPLYVSVHTTDPDLRASIMGRKRADDLAGKMRRLVENGIQINAQVVLLPQINDGVHLHRTVLDLYALHPGVNSVAIVPLGLSDHGPPRQGLAPVTPGFCRDVIRQVTPWQEEFRRKIGVGFTYLADEFYIQAGVPVPPASHYDDFSQIEDGIGMVRRFLDEFSRHLARRRRRKPDLCGTLATGTLFYPFLRDCVERFNAKLGSRLRVAAVENRFLGKSITVAGLLAGRDLVEGLAGRRLGDFVIIPEEALSQVERVFLDDVSIKEFAHSLGKPVFPSGRTMGDLFDLLCSRL